MTPLLMTEHVTAYHSSRALHPCLPLQPRTLLPAAAAEQIHAQIGILSNLRQAPSPRAVLRDSRRSMPCPDTCFCSSPPRMWRGPDLTAAAYD